MPAERGRVLKHLSVQSACRSQAEYDVVRHAKTRLAFPRELSQRVGVTGTRREHINRRSIRELRVNRSTERLHGPIDYITLTD